MFELGEEQIQALQTIERFIEGNSVVFSLTGPGGSGKSLLISELIKWLEDKGIDYCLCAPTHKAKTVLTYYSKREATTLHSLLSLSPKLDIINLDLRELEFKMGAPSNYIPYKGIVICDEASMISDDLYKLLIKSCKEFKCKILFVSDKCQLKPVNAERVSLVYTVKDSFNLTKIYRQANESALVPVLQELRKHIITKFETKEAPKGSLHCTSNFKDFFYICKTGIEAAIQKQDILEAKILAYTNSRVDKYNEYLTKKIFGDINTYHKGEILTCFENIEMNRFKFWNAMDYIVKTEPKKININIANLMLLPGYNLSLYDTGSKCNVTIPILDPLIKDEDWFRLTNLIEHFRLKAIRAPKNKSGKYWSMYYGILNSFTSPKDLCIGDRLIRKKTFDRGYAITVHRAQGSTFNNVYIDMTDFSKCKDIETLRQLQYVAMSRAHQDVYMLQ